MTFQEVIHPVRSEDLPRVVDVWEASVRAAHGFVEAYIQFFSRSRARFVWSISLRARREGRDRRLRRRRRQEDRGAVRASGTAPVRRWPRLANYAVSRGATSVDVDEQNEAAVRFFRALGFEVAARWDVDAMGKAFPVLHMRVPSPC
jgi:putative acetyltransferase